jgi:hypothetical protein
LKNKPTFRSGFEKSIYEQAIGCRRELDYERKDSTLHYTKPARKSRYLPDFRLPNGILIESKGRFTATDRAKMLNVARDNPRADIRFVFQRANNRITRSKNSMTYWEWAEKHGFRWSEGTIPEEWWAE